MPVELRPKLPSRRTVTIGSARDNDVIIDDPTVSRHHAIITRRGILRRRELSDLNSTNGTVVNGRRIDGPLAFRLDDKVRIGAVSVWFYSDSSYRALRLVLLALVLLCLFIGGFAATKYLLNQSVAPAQRVPATPSTSSVARRAIEVSSKSPDGNGFIIAPNHVRRLGVPSVTPLPSVLGSEVPTLSTPSVPEWLLRLNYYRRLARVAPLPEDSSLSAAEVSHSRYLVMNYSADFQVGSDLGRTMHREDASNQWYSPAGLMAAKHSDLYEGCEPLPAQSEVVDWWIAAPFHRLSLLNPHIRAAAYGSYQQPEGCWAAGLQLAPNTQAHRIHTELPVDFPGDGSEVSLTTITANEWPNVLTSYPGYALPAGLPITIQFGNGTTPTVTQTTITRNGQPVEHCLVEGNNYEHPDQETAASGRDVLKGFGAVVLIPRQPLLAASRYAVHIVADGHPYDWQFSTR